MQTPKITTVPYKYGEISPYDDYENKGFNGYANNATEPPSEKTKNWADDTAHKANWSIYSYIIELPIKIASYFISHSDFKDGFMAKLFSSIDDFTGTLGDMFRNQIYAHKDKDGKRDDNIGAQESVKKEDHFTYILGVINNHLQTKGKFLLSALSFINPTLANDLEWGIVRALDSFWWRNMSSNIAYGVGSAQKTFKNITNLFNRNQTDTATKNDSTINTIKKHFNNLIESWRSYTKSKDSNSSNPDKNTKNFMKLCQDADKASSVFLSLVSWINVFGDVARPIARRLGITGIPRNIIRLCSVIDRPFVWLVNIFRFYLPEKHLQKREKEQAENKHKPFNFIGTPDLLLGSVIGDMADFLLIAFEDKIKESSGSIQHLVEIARRVKDSASDIYFAARRRRAAHELQPQKKDANPDLEPALT